MRRWLHFIFPLLAASAFAYAPERIRFSPGAHQLSATAAHPSGQFTTNRSVWFTNNLAYEAAPVILRDASGNVTSKVWRKPDGSEIHGIQMWVDPKDRVYRLEITTTNGTGYRVLTDYDAFGRRMRTRWSTLTADLDPLGYVETLSHYDPQAEFLELGVTIKVGVGASGQTTWKLCGPDLNGQYGGLNGTGGFEASSSGGSSSMSPTIADARGNILGSLNSQLSTINWTAARPTGYGAVPGYRPLPLGHGGNLVQSSAWRGRYVDITGRVNLGARSYNPEVGSFESYDPTWNGRDPNYLTYAGGNPIDYFDADGRIATQIGKGIGGGYTQGDFYNAGDNFDRETGQFIGQIAGGLTPVWGQISDYRDTAAAVNALRTDGLGWGTGIGLALSAVAWVPGVGDAVKGFGKSILRGFDDVPVSTIQTAVEEGQMLYRGVPGNGTQKAILGQQGIAIPRGTALDPKSLETHVLGGDVNAGVTSWTTDRSIAAQRFAGPNGTVIEVQMNTVTDQIVPRPNVAKYGSENEVLLKGTVQGTPTKP